jgi:hypothetical protein
MGVLLDRHISLSSSIREEVRLKGALQRGRRGKAVRRCQEWLTLHGHRTVIDGVFGPATEATVRAYQNAEQLEVDGVVGPETHGALVRPLHAVLSPLPADERTLAELTLAYAQRHLAQHPIETGGQNRGPWVRLYMDGHEGTEWPWCAGFVSFVMEQAAQTLGVTTPVAGSVSCDTLAAQARKAGCFLSEREFRRGRGSPNDLPAACVFLVRRTASDWVHAGLVAGFEGEHFLTIEGNTNDDGNREGYELCARKRGYAGKDFIRL